MCPKSVKFFLALSLVPFIVKAQTLSGKVYRAGTDTAVIHASVYYGGSQTGTVTNYKGEFQIAQLPGKIPLVVSSVGYYSTLVSTYGDGQPLTVYLKPKLNELGSITIRPPSSLGRADMEHMFFKQFIGTSDNAISCVITNFDDIDLHYSRKTDKLVATCSKPIEIENKRMGYHISYYLDKFIGTGNSVDYEGNYIFQDKITSGNEKSIKHNRKEAYDGSRMEFIRALWSYTLDRHGYDIYTPQARLLLIDKVLVTDRHGYKFISSKVPIIIVHDHENWLASKVGQSIDSCYIDQKGFYDAGLQWSGHMADLRVGDMLPLEYNPAKDKK